MSRSSANTFLARQCGYCSEIMPRFEKVCYCGGPVRLIRLPLDKRALTRCYHERRFMFNIKNTKESDV